MPPSVAGGIVVYGYIQGEGRQQSSLFPPTLEELVPEDHLVRVIEAYVARLDLQALGFSKAEPLKTGRPGYDPADLLKFYLYGYFQRIRSSRRLEAECQRNVEVMWLLGRLVPDLKTIADFRKDNSAAFQATCRTFVQFCRQVGLISGQLVAIDGSKFQTVASQRKHLSLTKLKRQQAKLEAQIARYLAELDEARMMRTHQGARVAYNVQSAVDGEHGLILHHAVTQDGCDNQQLEPMAKAAQAILAQEELTVTYSDAGITAYVPENRGINNKGGDTPLFDRSAFTYDAENDQYQCPAGKWLPLKQVNGLQRIYAAQGDCVGLSIAITLHQGQAPIRDSACP